MARIRTIKPDFFLDDDLAELTPLARLLFAGLWCQADGEGRLEDRPRRLKVEILPYDNCDFDDLLGQLDAAGFIQRYAANDARLIQVTNFKRHQRISGEEAQTPSRFPPPPERTEPPRSGGEAAPKQSRSNGEGPVALEGKGREGKGKEGNGEACGEPSAAPPAAAADADLSVAAYGLVPEKPSPAVIELPCTGTGAREYAVTDAQVAEWSTAFPGVDVLAELRKARVWLDANRAKRKTHRGIPAFVVRWLGKAQDQPRHNGGSGSATGSDPPPTAQPFDPGFYDRQAEEFAREHARRTAQPRNGA